MNYFGDFFIKNFVLLCLSIVMIFNAIFHYRSDKRVSVFSSLITVCCFLLAAASFAQNITKPEGFLYATLTLSIIGYIVRPLCLYFFILMNKNAYRGKLSFLIALPIAINAIIFLCAYIPGTKEIIFGFYQNEVTGELSFTGGPLRYTSHIISIGYLLYLLYLSVFTLRFKHIIHGITLLVCAAFVTTAVVIETFFNGNGDIDLLNATIMVSTITYFLFLYKESMQVDTLTNIFNRETYYRDYARMSKTAIGIIQFDINGLKYINDNFGHEEGDKCISSIAKMISKSIDNSMYPYRMGGDEFLVIINKGDEESIINTVTKFKELLAKTEYYCSVGYAFKTDNSVSFDDLIKEAEKYMYSEKEKFYRDSPFERRRV